MNDLLATIPQIETVADLLRFRFILLRPAELMDWNSPRMRPWSGRPKRLRGYKVQKVRLIERLMRFEVDPSLYDGPQRLCPGWRGVSVMLVRGKTGYMAFIPEAEFAAKAEAVHA